MLKVLPIMILSNVQNQAQYHDYAKQNAAWLQYLAISLTALLE